MKQKVIIDCDPGIDDALALLLALTSPELDVIGITICAGNCQAPQGRVNALKVLNLVDRLDIPVYTNYHFSFNTAEDTHGYDGLGEAFHYNLVPDVDEPEVTAEQFIIDSINEHKYNLTIIALAPLTNIAAALHLDRDAFKQLGKFITMGGAFKTHGNSSPVAEFNYWSDSESAKYVYDNMPITIQMVGLDVTRKIVLTPNEAYYMKNIDEIGKFVYDITKFYMDFHWKQEHIIGCVINDPLAVAYAIYPTLCKGEMYNVDISTHGITRGMTVVDEYKFYDKQPNTLVLTGVDVDKFKHMFFSRLLDLSIYDIKEVLK